MKGKIALTPLCSIELLKPEIEHINKIPRGRADAEKKTQYVRSLTAFPDHGTPA